MKARVKSGQVPTASGLFTRSAAGCAGRTREFDALF